MPTKQPRSVRTAKATNRTVDTALGLSVVTPGAVAEPAAYVFDGLAGAAHGALPDLGVSAASIVGDVEAGRER